MSDATPKLPPGSPAGETASEPKCPYCNEPMKLGNGSYWCMNKKCAEQFYLSGHTAAVPEPVPTARQFELRDGVLWEMVSSVEHGNTWKPLGSVLELLKAQSAAPIAPAAAPDEVFEELEKALQELVDDLPEDRCASSHCGGDCGVRRRAEAALSRAESYRKGAKNG